MLAELGSEKGIGLIKRIKQGLGNPAKIFVMNFLITENPNLKEDEKVDSEEVLTSQKRKSRLPLNRPFHPPSG